MYKFTSFYIKEELITMQQFYIAFKLFKVVMRWMNSTDKDRQNAIVLLGLARRQTVQFIYGEVIGIDYVPIYKYRYD